MNKIEKIIQNVNENNQDKVDWTKAWSTKYPILKNYQKEVDMDLGQLFRHIFLDNI